MRTDQRTSIFLKNSTVQSAVHFTLLTNQLEQQVLDANTILIFPNTATKLKEYQEMVVKTFFLTNAEAKNVALTLKTILKSKDIVVDENQAVDWNFFLSQCFILLTYPLHKQTISSPTEFNPHNQSTTTPNPPVLVVLL